MKPSREIAESISYWANWIMIGSLAVGFVATAVVVWMGNAKEEYLKLDIASANTSAAKANEAARILDKEAAEARLETEKIKERVTWRSLTKDMAKEILPILSEKPESIIIAYLSNDSESAYFASQIAEPFRVAKWKVFLQSRTYNGVVVGMFIPDPPTPATLLVRKALGKIGFSFATDAIPPPGMLYGTGNTAPVTIMIGSRPHIFE